MMTANPLIGLPKTLKIGHLKYSVKIVASGVIEGCYGITDTEAQIIRLDVSMSPERAREVVVHEILHAIWSNQNLGPRAQEENAVSLLATGLVSLFAANPRLRKWFARELCRVS